TVELEICLPAQPSIPFGDTCWPATEQPERFIAIHDADPLAANLESSGQSRSYRGGGFGAHDRARDQRWADRRGSGGTPRRESVRDTDRRMGAPGRLTEAGPAPWLAEWGLIECPEGETEAERYDSDSS